MGRYSDGVQASVMAVKRDYIDSSACLAPYATDHNIDMLVWHARLVSVTCVHPCPAKKSKTAPRWRAHRVAHPLSPRISMTGEYETAISYTDLLRRYADGQMNPVTRFPGRQWTLKFLLQARYAMCAPPSPPPCNSILLPDPIWAIDAPRCPGGCRLRGLSPPPLPPSALPATACSYLVAVKWLLLDVIPAAQVERRPGRRPARGARQRQQPLAGTRVRHCRLALREVHGFGSKDLRHPPSPSLPPFATRLCRASPPRLKAEGRKGNPGRRPIKELAFRIGYGPVGMAQAEADGLRVSFADTRGVILPSVGTGSSKFEAVATEAAAFLEKASLADDSHVTTKPAAAKWNSGRRVGIYGGGYGDLVGENRARPGTVSWQLGRLP